MTRPIFSLKADRITFKTSYQLSALATNPSTTAIIFSHVTKWRNFTLYLSVYEHAFSEAAILKSRSKIKLSAFEQLFHKFNATLEETKKYKGYRIIAVDGSDFSSLYSADSEYATISNQYGGANRMHITFAYDIFNKNFLDCVILHNQKKF